MGMRIRLAMHGVRNHRIFHLVAIDRRQRRNAKPAELLGIYKPRLAAGETFKTVEWSVGRIRYWLSVGAEPSKSATKLLEMGGILRRDSKWNPGADSMGKSVKKIPIQEETS